MATHIVGGSVVTNEAPLEVTDAHRADTPSGAKSGQKTVTAAGSPVALGSQVIEGPVMVKAVQTNAGYVYVGNTGSQTVSSTTGLALLAGEVIVFEYVSNLNQIWLDSSVNGEGVYWSALRV
jgi:hypothetical protein